VARAQELSTHDADRALMALGLSAQAERIVHAGKPWLLLQLRVQDARYQAVSRGGGVTEYVAIPGSVEPFVVDCGGVTMEAQGRTSPAEPTSPCRGLRPVPRGGVLPLYVVLPYPEPGPVWVRIPVRERGAIASRALRLSVLVPEPQR
jgi:hypothetical protein